MSCALFKNIFLFSICICLTACSSNDGSSDNIDTGSAIVAATGFTITSTVSAGGSISPGSITVTSGSTTSFTLTFIPGSDLRKPLSYQSILIKIS